MFEVDKEGLAKILTRRGVEFAVLELMQNALDENTSEISIQLERIAGSAFVHLVVMDDNPTGFDDLSHAYTLFAESKKKSNPEQRGRFNLGEKLVIAACRFAEIITTTGTVRFEGKTRKRVHTKTTTGSVFRGELRMTSEQMEATERAVKSVIIPPNVKVRFNGDIVPTRRPRYMFEATLPTEVADDEGYLRPTARKAKVELYDVYPGQTPTLYEMGIPVVELEGDAFHIDVQQKVPLNTDRDNVTPAYLRKLRAYVLNHMAGELTKDQATAPWVNEALESNEVAGDAVKTVIKKRYGDKVVIADPSDHEGTQIAASKGYAVIQPRSFSKAAHANIRASQAALPAGKVTPSPKPFHPDGEPLKMLDEDKWTPMHDQRVAFVKRLAVLILGHTIRVEIANDIGWPFGGAYGSGRLILNQGRLGKDWFNAPHGSARTLDIIIHEFAHDSVSSHLDEGFHKACTDIGARVVELALKEPDLFSRKRWAT